MSEKQHEQEHCEQSPLDDGEEGATRKRRLHGIWGKYVYIVGLAMTIFHFYVLVISPITYWNLYSIHILFGLLLVFPIYRGLLRKKDGNSPGALDILCMLAACAAIVYCLLEAKGMAYRMGSNPKPLDLAAIGIILLLLLEGTRRIYGWALPIIATVFLLYARFGGLINGALGHRGYTWRKTISYMLSYEAVYGSPINASATMVYLFIVFGAFLAMSGAGPYFIDMAMGIAGAKRGGPAKVAVISSALFGTVSGNSVANVVSTGAFSIPLMRSVGYKAGFAGAVEATASTGGQIMPPILGSAAFIMAELLGIPYSEIMLASVIPALLYFYTIFVMVDIEAAKNNLLGIERDKLPARSYILKNIYMLMPLIVLTLVLTVLGQSPIRAATWGISTCIVIFLIKSRGANLSRILDTMSEGARSACGMICACGTAGIVVGVLNMTGAGIKFANVVLEIADGSLIIALLLTMISSLVLGMGLPTTASYIICAAVAAPALIEMGLLPIQAHMFVFYFACVSAITPPVAMAAYAAATISGAKPMEVGFLACKLGICAFIVPFMFCYSPSLLWLGSGAEIVTTIVTALIGVTVLAFGLLRYVGFLNMPIGPLTAIGLIVFALFMIIPGMFSDVIGIAGITAIMLALFFSKRKAVEKKYT